MDFYDGSRYIHIMSGTVALATFWTAAFLRKGSRNHLLVGRTYLIAMALIVVTAVPLALGAFARGKPVTGSFLLYLLVITGSPAWLAWRAIRDKQSVQRYTGRVYHALAWLNIAAGAIVFYLGMRFDAFLLTGFSVVGVVTGAFMLRYARKPPTDRTWYLSRHYGSMIACGVATHVAFLNLGLSRLAPPEWSTTILQVSFFGPLAISIVARYWLDRKYGRKPRKLSVPASAGVHYAPLVAANLDNGRLMCSSFDSSPAASAKATESTACSAARTPALNPAALSQSLDAAVPASPRY